MIVKNLSRRNANGSNQLVTYIFRYIFRDQTTDFNPPPGYDQRWYWPKGIKLTERDIKHLCAEYYDRSMLKDLYAKYPSGDIKAYVKNYLMPKETIKDAIPGQDGKNKIEPFIIKHNMRANSIEGFIREFNNVERGRIHTCSNMTSIHHTILSWSNKDSALITESMLRDMSKEYIRLRGEMNIYCGTVHIDKNHIHLHVAMGGTNLEGKSSRISKEKFEEVKMELQQFQLAHYPELVNSVVDFGRSKREKQKEEMQKIHIAERSSGKHSLLQCIETNYAKARSTEDFLSLLIQNGYSAYYINGALTGIIDHGYKYRFTTLGVDMEHLQQLDNQKTVEKENLKQLRELRGLDKREIRLVEIKEGNKIDLEISLSIETESTSLKELQDIRERNEGDFERAFDRDSFWDSEPDDVIRMDTAEQNEQEDDEERNSTEDDLEDTVHDGE